MKKYIKIIVICFSAILLSLIVYIIAMQNQGNKSEFEKVALFYVGHKRYGIFEPLYTIYDPFFGNYIVKMKGYKEVVYAKVDENKRVDIIVDFNYAEDNV